MTSVHKCGPGLGPSPPTSNTVRPQALTFALHVVFSFLLAALGQKTLKGRFNSDNITARHFTSYVTSNHFRISHAKPLALYVQIY